MKKSSNNQQWQKLLKNPKSLIGLIAGVLALVATQEPWELLTSPNDSSAVVSEAETSSSSHQAALTNDQEIAEHAGYTSPEEVAAYIDQYDKLPENYITKDEAESMGWESNQGNLWEVTDNKSIGGDHFGNYEGLLPEEDQYREADVNYEGGYRGPERIIYSDDGDIYYTDDHYETFEQLY